jgi:two-component system, LuxR family, sensor kinase FixL
MNPDGATPARMADPGVGARPAASIQSNAARLPVPELKSDKLYRTLIESLPQHVFFKDRNSVFVSVNAAFAADVGKKPEDLIGKSDFDLFPKELAEKYCADDQRVMQQRVPETLEEVNVAGGKWRIVEVVKAPVVDDDGEVIGLLGIFTDITERKTSEENLRDFASRLERSNRELENFASVASHDLQEPLRKITVFAERLRARCGESLAPEAHDYLQRIDKATLRMQALINDLLMFSRVTTRPQPFAPVNLGKVVREVLSDLEGRLEQVGGSVEIGALPTIEAEPLQMRQLFQNLIGNALKFHKPNEKPVVKIDGTVLHDERRSKPRNAPTREMVQITVADNGIGFEEKYLDRIFEVFQRLHGRGTYEGTGMGLAIARKIVERHGGQITAKSKPDEGATFIITLPVRQRRPDEPI